MAAAVGALTLAYPHTPPFLSWGRFEECAHTLLAFAQRQGQPRLLQRTGAQQQLRQVVWMPDAKFPEA